eukprot:SAG11_NODE_4958_length_1710_cov_320.311608_1_plen_33_part_10
MFVLPAFLIKIFVLLPWYRRLRFMIILFIPRSD